jgi:AcrR family transcriptional regulator
VAKIALDVNLHRVQNGEVTTPEPCEPGLRERKKRARRAQLVDAAQSLVLEHGFDAVTVEAISAEAGVSTRTFFNYFDSKDDAVLGLEALEPAPQVACEFAAGGPSGHLLTDLQPLVASLLDNAAPDHSRVRRAMAIMRSEPHLLARQMAWMERHKAVLAELFAARRTVRPSPVDDHLLGLVSMVLVHTAAQLWERCGYTGDAGDQVADAVGQLTWLFAADTPAGTPADALTQAVASAR